MAANFNKVILAGNLTRDPELRYTPGGTAVAKFGLAVNRRYTGQDGLAKDETTFVDVDCFGKQAETIGQYLKKGRPILMEGRLKLDQWDDKATGQKRYRLGVILESFRFVDSKRDDSGAGEQGSGGAGARPSRPAPRIAEADKPKADADLPPIEDDDVPF